MDIIQTNFSFVYYQLNSEGFVEFKYQDEIEVTKKSLLFTIHPVQLVMFFCKKYIFIIPFESGAGYRQPIGIINTQTNIFEIKEHAKQYLPAVYAQIKELLARHQDLFYTYLENGHECKLATYMTADHWGHIIRDDLPSMCQMIEKFDINTIFYRKSAEKYFTYKELFKYASLDINLREHNQHDNEETLKYCLTNNLYFYKPYGDKPYAFFLQNFIKNYYKAPLKVALKSKVVLLVCKYDYRSPINQLELFASIIKFYNEKWKDVTFLIQNYVQPLNSADPLNNPNARPLIEAGDQFFNVLKSNNPGAGILNLNNISIKEYINYAQNADMYFSPYGSLQHLSYAFSKGNGIVYGLYDQKNLTGYGDTTVLLPTEYLTTNEQYDKIVCGANINTAFRFKFFNERNYEIDIKQFLGFLEGYHLKNNVE